MSFCNSPRRAGFVTFGMGAASAFALLGIGAVGGAQAQSYTLGGDARAFAMGGAGIAVAQEAGGNRINPASLSFERKTFGYNFPSFGMRADNFDANDAANFFANGGKLSDATGLLQKFANDAVKGDASLGLNANASVRVGHFEISGFGVGKADLLPNAAFQRVANGSTNLNDANSSRVDLIAAGYYTLPAVALGTTLPVKDSSFYNYGVGVRVKAMTGFYSHYIADNNALFNGGDAARAPEMGSADYLKKSGVGADLGFLAHPRQNQGFSFALVGANLVNPNFTFHGTDQNGKAVAYDIIKPTYTSGLAYQKKSLTLAADWVDMTSATGPAQLRAGIEEKMLGNRIAVRGGYNSASGFTYGGGLFGFDVAFGKQVPLEVVKTLNF